MTQNGSNLIVATQVLRTFWEEAVAFKGELWRVLQQPRSPAPAVSFTEEVSDAKNAAYQGAPGWVYDGWHWSFRAFVQSTRSRRTAVAGQLSILVDIGGPLRPALALGYPCFVVAWASGAGGNWAGEFKDLWPKEAAEATIRAGFLFIQSGSDVDGPLREAHWFYLFPLMSMKTPEAMKRLIVDPVFALLSGATPNEVSDQSSDVLRFGNDNGAVKLLSS